MGHNTSSEITPHLGENFSQADDLIYGIKRSLEIYLSFKDDGSFLRFLDTLIDIDMQMLAGMRGASLHVKKRILKSLQKKIQILGAAHDGVKDTFSLSVRIEEYYKIRNELLGAII